MNRQQFRRQMVEGREMAKNGDETCIKSSKSAWSSHYLIYRDEYHGSIEVLEVAGTGGYRRDAFFATMRDAVLARKNRYYDLAKRKFAYARTQRQRFDYTMLGTSS